MNNYRSLIYVNFSPYENTGNILDYILENFNQVYAFSFDFHALNNKRSSKLRVYNQKRLTFEKSLLTFPLSESLIFLLLPIRSLLILLQVFWYILRFKNNIKRPTIYFTVNGFTAWVGNLLRRVNLVDKTVFWVWDYYPPGHPSLIIRLMRKLYWYFDSISIHSDRLIFLNHRLVQLRRNIGVLPPSIKYTTIPIGTNPKVNKQVKKNDGLNLAFIGVLKKTQGLDRVFDYADSLMKQYKKVKLHIIGSGPDEGYFKNRASVSPLQTVFYGLLSDQKASKVLSICDIGIALYLPEKNNLSYYGDPSKVKKYLSYGLPVITTDVYEFSKEIEKSGAGILVNYNNASEFINSIEKIMGSYSKYRKNAKKLAVKYYYRKIYSDFFNVTL